MTAFMVRVAYSPTSPPIWTAEARLPDNPCGAGTSIEQALTALGRFIDAAGIPVDDPRFPMFDNDDRLLVETGNQVPYTAEPKPEPGPHAGTSPDPASTEEQVA